MTGKISHTTNAYGQNAVSQVSTGQIIQTTGGDTIINAEPIKTRLEEYRDQGVDLQLSDMYQEQLEAAKENAEAMGEGYKDMARALEIARRMMKGDIVPGADEKFLMDYNKDIYMGAKNMQAIAQNENSKKHDSLLEEEESEGGEVMSEDGDIRIDASGLNLVKQPGVKENKSVADLFSGGFQW